MSEVHMLSWLSQAAVYLGTLPPVHLTGRQIAPIIPKAVVVLQGSVHLNESSCIDLLFDVVFMTLTYFNGVLQLPFTVLLPSNKFSTEISTVIYSSGRSLTRNPDFKFSARRLSDF